MHHLAADNRPRRLLRPLPGLAMEQVLRGHEFHYATITAQPDPALADVTDATGQPVTETGSFRVTEGGGVVSGSFFHLIAPASNGAAA